MRRPLTGAILGILIGLAIAVVLQQQGVWPLDKITVFLLPAVTGLIGLIVLTVGREGGTVTLVIALIILIPMAIWGATGLPDIDQQGELNGECEVMAWSEVPDTTNVTDTRRSDPFKIDPNGGLRWAATSPVVFDDYAWEIRVEIGGVDITLDEEENQDNDGGSQINGDEVANVTAYAAARGIDISELRGVYKVGGFAATCNGFGFVSLIADPLETTTAKVAAGLGLLLLIILLILAFTGRQRPVTGSNGDLPNGPADAGDLGAAGAAAAGAAGGAALGDDDDAIDEYNADPGSDDLPERDDLA